MKKNAQKNEKGMVVVEAVIILPLVILSVFLLIFISLIMFEKAVMQSSLETALLYYTSELNDDFINIKSGTEYQRYVEENGGKTETRSGNLYNSNSPLLAYRNLFGNSKKKTSADFEKYFLSVGHFISVKDMHATLEYKNHFIYQEYKATAKQTLKWPIDFSSLGLSDEYVIEVYATAVSVDHEEIVDNMDFVVHIINRTKLGDLIKNLSGKVQGAYGKARNFLGAK